MSECQAPLPHKLSTDLWGKIFAGVQSLCDADDADDCCSYNLANVAVLCRKFRDVVQSVPELTSHPIVQDTVTARTVVSLNLWLKQHGHSVTTFEAQCSDPYQELALATLLCVQPALDKIKLLDCTPQSFELMTSFTSLTSCLLNTHSSRSSNISCMAKLPHLNNLCLINGFYVATQLPARLASLELDCHRANL